MDNKIEDMFEGFSEVQSEQDFKNQMIKVGVEYGMPLVKKFVTEDLPKIVDKVKADKEIKKQEKKEVIDRYKSLIDDIKARTTSDLSMTTEEYLACLDKIEELEQKIKTVQENKTAKIVGVSTLAVATGGLSLLAGFIISKAKKSGKKNPKKSD